MPQQQLKLRSTQNQALTPRLQYAVRLLQLSAVDYELELRGMVDRNPFLDADEPEPPPLPLSSEPWADAEALNRPDTAEPESAVTADGDADAYRDEGAPDRDHWGDLPGPRHDGNGELRASPLDLMAAEVGLRSHLRGQANLLPLSARDHAMVCATIESLDDDGYLRIEADEIAALLDLQPAAEAGELATALKLVQSFEPVGVGARSVGECLLLQLEGLEARPYALARAIVSEHLERLAHRDVPGLARLTGRTLAEVEAACQAIRRLDPRPGWRHGRNDAEYIVPDLVARKIRGQWKIDLNPAVVPRVRLNGPYADLFQRHRQAGQGELASHLQEARWAVRNAEQRFSTILQIGRAIAQRQVGFFEFGPLGMKPLGLREIADEVGVHESTVCRVTNNKYIAAPTGVFELKQFFSRPLPMASGNTCSATAIRGVIREVVAAENPGDPLTDVEITQRLSRQGLKVARRTVTKYRQMLQIEPVERRRRHGPVVGAAA